MTCPGCENAYRVLMWGGRVANDFRWNDGEDHRDPADLLSSEGVRFSGGHADAEQQLMAEDLLELVGGVEAWEVACGTYWLGAR